MIARWLLPVIAAFGLVALGVLAYVEGWWTGGDTAVYRAGAIALMAGDPLYESTTLAAEPFWALLPFTYPPTATLLFVPLAALPIQIGWGVLNAISALALALVTLITLRHVPRRPEWLSPGWTSALVAVVLLAIEPSRLTFEYGQINLILLAMIVIDVLVLRGSRWSGVLIGIASAVKLTPLVFVVHFLITGRKADAVRAVGVFAGAQVLMLIISAPDTWRFWTHTVTDVGRIGPTAGPGNQSISGTLLRLSDAAAWSRPVTYLVVAVLAVPALLLVRRYHERGRPLHALLVMAFFGMVASPVSWAHHWVWVAPLLVLLLAEAFCGNRMAMWLLPVTVMVFVVQVFRVVFPLIGLDALVDDTYVEYTLAVGIVFLVAHRRASVRDPAQVG
ncbi:alpha-1,2-mannosyltransferase [Herbihabitans rhizosphaerae]|uniref:Alpha-1,2-mannosyltransferase n=1 Tax=Herbihabitans rhizosphaerae TaxID=1872711 RepID=A0A4Q7KFP7_9PSEU|nr:glycosyltransferase 87 family protein [Herbihabitans rhizosphaerae]RZS33879.1 alpha-1,2-mannosyltransferase [Herbihabitans rhizosphaerae]